MIGPEGFDGDRYSRITYHSLTIDQPEAGTWLIKGELEMHGRFLPLDVRAERRGNRFTGAAAIRLADFGVPPLAGVQTSTPGGNEVRVDFDVVLEKP